MGNLYMLKPNEKYVIEEDGSIHWMRFCGEADWEESATTSVQEIRNKAIDDFVKEMKGNARDGLITNWYKPYGISYERIDELAAQMKGE